MPLLLQKIREDNRLQNNFSFFPPTPPPFLRSTFQVAEISSFANPLEAIIMPMPGRNVALVETQSLPWAPKEVMKRKFGVPVSGNGAKTVRCAKICHMDDNIWSAFSSAV